MVSHFGLLIIVELASLQFYKCCYSGTTSTVVGLKIVVK